MTIVNERVKNFVEWWRETHCVECECELTDGNVTIVNGRLICSRCYKSKIIGMENGYEHKQSK
jgi:formylmethanofuran dehydrogenase subunit E